MDRLERMAWCAYALRDVMARRRIGGQPCSPQLGVALLDIDQELAGSDSGTGTGSGPTQLKSDNPIGSSEAAAILGCSDRYVRKVHADLGGRRCGNRWVFQRQTVVDYATAKGVGTHGNS